MIKRLLLFMGVSLLPPPVFGGEMLAAGDPVLLVGATGLYVGGVLVWPSLISAVAFFVQDTRRGPSNGWIGPSLLGMPVALIGGGVLMWILESSRAFNWTNFLLGQVVIQSGYTAFWMVTHRADS